MAFIPKNNITTGNTILSSDITNIIDSLNGTGSYTIDATGSFSGSFKGALNGTADATGSFSGSFKGTGTFTLVNSTGSFSGSFKGALNGTASWATKAVQMSYAGLTDLPNSIQIEGNSKVTTLTNSSLISGLNNGVFYTATTTTHPISISLDDAGLGLAKGYEYTFFAEELNASMSFTTSSVAVKVISENGYLTMYGTGSVVTAKMISFAPPIWALIGSLKS